MYFKPCLNLIWFIFECGFEIGKENRKKIMHSSSPSSVLATAQFYSRRPILFRAVSRSSAPAWPVLLRGLACSISSWPRVLSLFSPAAPAHLAFPPSSTPQPSTDAPCLLLPLLYLTDQSAPHLCFTDRRVSAISLSSLSSPP